MTIIDFAQAKADREPHVSGEAFCIGCSHTWAGVWPLGVTELECPECKRMMGRSKYEVMPPKGTLSFTCKCGNQLFGVLEDRIHCPNCGAQTFFSELPTA